MSFSEDNSLEPCLTASDKDVILDAVFLGLSSFGVKEGGLHSFLGFTSR